VGVVHGEVCGEYGGGEFVAVGAVADEAAEEPGGLEGLWGGGWGVSMLYLVEGRAGGGYWMGTHEC